MVQRKTCQAIESNNPQPETRFGQEHLKILGPEMMMMKRTKPKRKLKDNSVSPSGKTQSPPKKHDLGVKGTCMSPNYMKGTSSSEARFNLSKNQKNQTGSKHDSRYGVNKERSNKKLSSRIVRGFTKAPSFKRCSQRATCSSTLKDSKFPEYLMLNHGETDDEVSGTSVLKVCPYKYCSLNGHLHAQYPPLKSFISSRRRSLKSQKSVKMEAPKEDFVEMYAEEKKECENGNGGACEVDVETQISETVSVGAPRSETDSDEYSDSAEMVVKFSEGDDGIELKESDFEETLVDDDSVKNTQETCEVDDHSDSVEMVMFSEGGHGIELRGSDLEKVIVDDDSVEEIQETCEVDDYPDNAEMVVLLEGDHDMEDTLVDDSVKQIQEKANRDEEVMGMMKNSEADNASEDDNDVAGEDTAEDCKEESQDQIEETAKVPFNRTVKSCNQEEESDETISWKIIKCKKPVAETEDLRGFNPREPNYLPVVADADTEKVDLKHQDMDERRNSEDWMFDYALQRAVTKLSSARKRKVALLVEAFETVPHGREPAPVLSYGRHLQTCN
uniref:Calmodulin-binding domain-containing protein n=1 Tax=Noccaea caerulescens TaxID=107243 RepID=A0A1J3K3X5_NOCCA